MATATESRDGRVRRAFLALTVAQAAHSIEEYTFGLYAVFAPARFASGLVSNDLATGFAILNAALVAFGGWCYLARVRTGAMSARAWIWPWVVIEFVNGMTHPALAITRGSYFPGVATAPLLLALAVYLAAQLVGSRPSSDLRR